MIFGRKTDIKKLKQTYAEQLRKRDKEIAELNNKLKAALNSALKQSREKAEIQAHARRLLDINKELKEELRTKEKTLNK